jgi:hypothetical protein
LKNERKVTVKKSNIFFVLVVIVTMSVNTIAQTEKENMVSYIQAAKNAANENDLSFACDLLRHATLLAKGVENGKYYTEVQKTASNTCNASLAQAVNNFETAKKMSPFANQCNAYRNAKSQCATAGNYNNCMNIKFGTHHTQIDEMTC